MKRLVLPSAENNYRPWLLHLRGLLTLSFLLLVVFFNYGSVLNLFSRPAVLGWQGKNVSPAKIIELLNTARAEKNLPPLEVDRRLEYAAFLKANDMFAKGYWAHRSPSGQLPWYFIEAAGYDYQLAGENLAKNFSSSSSLVAAWLRSPAHRANILNPDYSQVGVSVVKGKLNGVPTELTVAFFAKPLSHKTSQLIKDVLAKGTLSSFQEKNLEVDPAVNYRSFKELFGLGILFLLLLAALADYYYTEKELPRRYHSYSHLHLIFLSVLMILVIFLSHQVGVIK